MIKTLAYASLLSTLLSPVLAQTKPLPITITVEPGARQTFRGLGASIFPWDSSAQFNSQLTRPQQKQLARLLWHDAGFRSARLWVIPDDFFPAATPQNIGRYVDGYVKTHKVPDALAAGLTELILAPDRIPVSMGDGHGLIKAESIPDYAALLAGFIRVFRDQTGILINHCGVLNEPNDRPIKLSDAQWPMMIKELRKALDARGLQTVGIVAPESANCGADAYAVVDAIKADPEAWRDLEGVATHSYNNAAREEMAQRTLGKRYWITEAGGITDADEDAQDGLQAASAASRFLNDVNHRVTDWQFFIGAEQADPRGNTGRVIKYDPMPYRPTILQKYFYLKQLSATFPLGSVFRHSVSGLEGEMDYTYGKKPRLNAAIAKRPDGTWGVGLSDYTSTTFQNTDDPKDFSLHNSGYAAVPLQVTLYIAELTKVKSLRFTVYHSTATVSDQPNGVVVMHYGTVIVPVQPLELVTLVSRKP